MQPLVAVLLLLVAIAVLYAIAVRVALPYPTLFVLGGLALAFVPGVPHIRLEPELVLLVFLPPLLFVAASEMPVRELRNNVGAISRLALGLVLVTVIIVAVAAQLLVPSIGWPAAFALGAIVAPTDPVAATAVFRRLGVPRIVHTLVEGEALFNDATALVIYHAAVAAAVAGTFVLANTVLGFGVALLGGITIGLVVGWVGAEILARIDEPTVEVLVSFVLPFAAYLPADAIGASGVIAAVSAGLVIGSRSARILTARSRFLWLGTWRMIDFVLNGFLFVLIGLELPTIIEALHARTRIEIGGVIIAVCIVVIVTRFAWTWLVSYLPTPPNRVARRIQGPFANRLRFIVSWSGLRGAVSLAAALALPGNFPERELILLITFAVIMVTLVGQGATLPFVVSRAMADAPAADSDEPTLAREVAYQAGLAEVERQRPTWPYHKPLLDRLESGLKDRTQHLATSDPTETAERNQEHEEHQRIQRSVIDAQRAAVIGLRDSRRINDATLRQVERELDLEELRMEG